MAELIKADGYNTWCQFPSLLSWPHLQHAVQLSLNDRPHCRIELLAKFTVASLNSYEWASNSIFYLLSLWSRLVMSLPYLKSDTSKLSRFVPEIIKTYIQTRLESVVRTVGSDSADDPLEDEARLTEQLETIPVLCRYRPSSTLPNLSHLRFCAASSMPK